MTQLEKLPDGLKIQSVAPHERHPWARDETCFNYSETRFVAAFNIVEATMMNDMGKFIWGSIVDQQPVVTGFLKEVTAYCWERPFVHWLDDRCFAVKVAPCRQLFPVIAVHFDKGFQVLDGLDHRDSRASHADKTSLRQDWLENERDLLQALTARK